MGALTKGRYLCLTGVLILVSCTVCVISKGKRPLRVAESRPRGYAPLVAVLSCLWTTVYLRTRLFSFHLSDATSDFLSFVPSSPHRFPVFTPQIEAVNPSPSPRCVQEQPLFCLFFYTDTPVQQARQRIFSVELLV